jgi:hypothetical protein
MRLGATETRPFLLHGAGASWLTEARLGLLALAGEAMRQHLRQSWTWLSFATGVVFLVLAGACAFDNFDLVDALLFVGGLVLLPAWLIWTAEAMFRPEPLSGADV